MTTEFILILCAGINCTLRKPERESFLKDLGERVLSLPSGTWSPKFHQHFSIMFPSNILNKAVSHISKHMPILLPSLWEHLQPVSDHSATDEANCISLFYASCPAPPAHPHFPSYFHSRVSLPLAAAAAAAGKGLLCKTHS